MENLIYTSINLLFSLVTDNDTPLMCWFRLLSFISFNYTTGHNIYKILDLLTNSFLGTYLFAIITFKVNGKPHDKELVMRNSLGIAMIYTSVQINTKYNVFGIMCKLFTVYLLLGLNSIQ